MRLIVACKDFERNSQTPKQVTILDKSPRYYIHLCFCFYTPNDTDQLTNTYGLPPSLMAQLRLDLVIPM